MTHDIFSFAAHETQLNQQTITINLDAYTKLSKHEQKDVLQEIRKAVINFKTGKPLV